MAAACCRCVVGGDATCAQDVIAEAFIVGSGNIDQGWIRLRMEVRAHQSNLVARLQHRLDDAQQRLNEIQELLKSIGGEERPPVEVESAESLMDCIAAIQVLAQRYDLFSTALARKQFPLERRKPGESAAVSVVEPVRRWLISSIYRWKEWQALFSRISKSDLGLVDLVSRGTEGVPIKSDDFHNPFCNTLSQVSRVLRERTQDAIRFRGESMRKEIIVALGGQSELKPLLRGLEGKPSIRKKVDESLEIFGESESAEWLNDGVESTITNTLSPCSKERNSSTEPCRSPPNSNSSKHKI